MRIDTQGPTETPDDDMIPPNSGRNGEPHPRGGPVDEALEELRASALTRHVDPICTAYSTLRDAAPDLVGRELLILAEERLKMPVARMVISAYSHKSCYMCDEGTVVCDSCEGAGEHESSRPCMLCDGLGLTVCGFCGGTGWADRSEVPPELARAVAKRQLAHVLTDLKDLQQITATLDNDEIRHMPADRRGALAGRLFRMQARLGEMAQCGICDEPKVAYIATLVERLDDLLDSLRR